MNWACIPVCVRKNNDHAELRGVVRVVSKRGVCIHADLQSLHVQLNEADSSRVLTEVGDRGVQSAHLARGRVFRLYMGKLRAHEGGARARGDRDVRELSTKVGLTSSASIALFFIGECRSADAEGVID